MSTKAEPTISAPVTTEAAAAQSKAALERAGKDLDASSEGARTATQSAILINGGAATAILAYLAKDTAPQLMNAAAVSLFFYAAGVFCAAWSMWSSSQASAKFGYYWGAVVDGNDAGKREHWKSGQDLLWWHRYTFFASIACFIIASGWIALTFWQLHPAAAPPQITQPAPPHS
jgi:hypothetical protein